MNLRLELTLLSDTTFGRGDGVSGVVDEEVEYDAETGLPFVRARTLKGLLVEECANILYALESANDARGYRRFQVAASRLFGEPGSGTGGGGLLHVGAAQLPEAMRETVMAHVQANQLTPAEVLSAFTVVRRQTANDLSGAPAEGSLRSSRAVIRQTTFSAVLSYEGADDDWDALALLAVCVAALRRAGGGRNRGRGRLSAALFADDVDLLPGALTYFEQTAQGEP